MKRDRSLFATSAFGLLLALPYPGMSFAHDMLPAAAGTGPQVEAGTIVLAQNEQSPDENGKKRRGHGEEHEGGGHAQQRPGREGQEGHQRQGHGDQGQQRQGQQERGHQEQERHGGQAGHEGGGRKLRQAESPNQAGPAEKMPETGNGHNKTHEYRQAPRSAEPQAQEPSAPQNRQAQHQQRKHEGQGSQGEGGQGEGGHGEGRGNKAQAPKPEYRLAPKQPAQQQPGQAPSGGQAQSPASPSQENEHRGQKNGESGGRKQLAPQGAQQSSPQPSPQSSPKGGTPPSPNGGAAPASGPQHQPAGKETLQQGNKANPAGPQGGNGKLQLPEQNGMQQQRPNFPGQGHRQNGEANGGRPRNAAPVFDSQKRPFGQGQGGHHGQQGNQPPSPNAPAQGAAQFGPAPKSDQAAQSDVRHGKIQSIDTIKGRRVDRDQLTPFQRPKGADVVKEIGTRVLIQMGTQVIVQNRDRDQRIAHGARNVYYEDLPDDRTRETILRPDGSWVITIRNDYGDVIRRSRIMPDGRELVLVYVDNRDIERDRDDGWRDPGADLPPMRLTVPEDDYILDASEIRDPDRYYEFLDQPPVERVPRLYTIGEVKRSARIRDMIPRIDLDTINFDFGSAKIDQSEVSKLQVVADAIERILKKNPAETFLIEGHTDAVGSPQSNLVLSDERAESVATALTNVFGIPPENLTTQGYGEEFLKINTNGPNRENRRVTIRRITPLIAPVARNQ